MRLLHLQEMQFQIILFSDEQNFSMTSFFTSAGLLCEYVVNSLFFFCFGVWGQDGWTTGRVRNTKINIFILLLLIETFRFSFPSSLKKLLIFI